jgi:hypothetical protein
LAIECRALPLVAHAPCPIHLLGCSSALSWPAVGTLAAIACQFSRVVSWSASADPSSKARFVQTSSQKMRVYSPRSALLSVACLHSPRRLLEILQGIVERSYGAKYVPSMLAVSRAASTIDGTLGVCICNIFFLTSCWLLLAALLFFTPFCALDCALLFPLSVLLFFLLLMLDLWGRYISMWMVRAVHRLLLWDSVGDKGKVLVSEQIPHDK